MANKRRIKKEIDYIISDLVLDCITFTNLYNKPNDEKALEIIQDTLSLRSELRNKVNHPESKPASVSSKSYYNSIAKELLEGIDAAYNRLGELVKENTATE